MPLVPAESLEEVLPGIPLEVLDELELLLGIPLELLDELDDEEADSDGRPEGRLGMLDELPAVELEGIEGIDELELEELLLGIDGLDRDELLLVLGMDGELELLDDDDEEGMDGIEDELLEELCCSSQALTARPSTTAIARERSFNGPLLVFDPRALTIEGAAITASVCSNQNLSYARPSA
ncbi:MAG: hypothetical protein V4603_06825 [Pseudomonadota bacterium]